MEVRVKKNVNKDPTLQPEPSVLIVDESREARGVLRTVLESRGINTLEADGEDSAMEAVRRHRPAVTVVDEDVAPQGRASALGDLGSSHATSLVVLGKARQFGFSVPKDRILSKPYHYGPLVRTIEQLLEDVRTNH